MPCLRPRENLWPSATRRFHRGPSIHLPTLHTSTREPAARTLARPQWTSRFGCSNPQAGHFTRIMPPLNAAFAEVYGWNPETWESELKAKKVPDVQREKTLRDRSDLFWEPLAQNLASELFGSPEYKGTSQPVPDAKVILVRTTIPGERDLLYSVSRRISMAFHRDDLTRPELALEVFLPRAMRLPTLPPVG